MRLTRMSILVAALLACLAGCQHANMTGIAAYTDDGQYLPPPSGPGLVASKIPLLEDVPIPVGFKVLPDRSSTTVEPGFRRAHHVYQGRAEPAEVVRFYRDNLERYGWKNVQRSTDVNSGASLITARKGQQRLTVNVTVRHNVATVVVDVAPAAPTSTI